jgi:polysaccharide biosynthesis PFTS motif protein
MKMSQVFSHSLNRILILLGRHTSLESDLQSQHAKLIAIGYYKYFREVMEAFYLRERRALNQVNKTQIFAGLSARDIQLGAIQKSMLRTLQTNNFKKAISYSKLTNTRLWFPISRKSQLGLDGLDIAFNPIMCSCLNMIFRFLSIVKALQKAISNYIFLIHNFAKVKKSQASLGDMVYLGGFSASNFPSANFATYDFLQWVQHKLVTKRLYLHDCSKLDLTCNPDSTIQVRYNPIVTSIGSFCSEFLVLLRLTFAIMRSFLWSKVSIFDLLSQIDELFIAVRIGSNMGARIDLALFPNTVVVARPLWTISLEQIGAEIVLVNYSASAEPLEIDSKRVVDGVWNLSSWTRTWIVDAYQEQQMRAISQFSAKNFEIVGVPYWSGRRLETSFFAGGPWVSVFDTTIRTNLVFSASSIDDLGWNNPHLEKEFIRLVLEAAAPLGLKILHKKKRRVSERSEVGFEETARILMEEFGDFYRVVDEDVAPETLIENSSFVISKPISTIAFAAAHGGVPTIILDPTGNVSESDPGLRGLPLAHTSSDLSSFFLNKLKS